MWAHYKEKEDTLTEKTETEEERKKKECQQTQVDGRELEQSCLSMKWMDMNWASQKVNLGIKVINDWEPAFTMESLQA